MEALEKGKQAEYGAWLSIGVYIGLSLLKLGIGFWGDSKALMADGLNNTTDIIASLAVLIGLKISKKPADTDHRYGHSRAETVASMVASFIMVAVGLEVLTNSVLKLIRGDVQSPSLLAAVAAAIAAFIMYAVYRYNLRLAEQTNSHALKAVAADNKSDAWVSLGTVVGIVMSVLGLAWLDNVTAILVGGMICKTGWDIFREATHMLTDGFDEEELRKYKVTIAAVDGVEKVLDIKGRSHGNQIFVDLTIAVRSELSVSDSHDITENVENELIDKHQVHHVHVHIEPYA
ncbi:cation diffusion facilitator family transporter [Paenibacillus whitsoniae]|uniref:Cation transporter n=1 Tax=Paenibacillus whitsoniae TaxID=2496558 RepID=A0A430J5B2_9BACL|nr:cation diffusion facilitator family transporter [Paenibacillus whitsoniae]RTE02548.1 cation transporter [Paenibacillus whitsoniae]